ncbi:MAG: substrate-binding domain-containing protein, partial [Clostridia bacterium]
NPPTAMIASNDLQALGFWERCQDLGISIPASIALSGMDNLDEMQMLHLSSIRMMEDQVGREGAEILINQLTSHDHVPSRDACFQTELVLRASTENDVKVQ